MIHADGKYQKRRKTRFSTIILTSEKCELCFDFVILFEAHYGSTDRSSKCKTTEKRFLDLVKLSQMLAWSLMSSETDFNETENLNIVIYTYP